MKIVVVAAVLGLSYISYGQTDARTAAQSGHFTPACDKAMQKIGYDAEAINLAWDDTMAPPVAIEDLYTASHICDRAGELRKIAAEAIKNDPRVCAVIYKRLPTYYAEGHDSIRMTDNRLLGNLGVLSIVAQMKPKVEAMKAAATKQH